MKPVVSDKHPCYQIYKKKITIISMSGLKTNIYLFIIYIYIYIHIYIYIYILKDIHKWRCVYEYNSAMSCGLRVHWLNSG